MQERIEVFHMKRVNFWLLGTMFLWSFSIFSTSVPSSVSFGFLSFNQETRTAYVAASNAVSGNDFAIASRRYNQTDLTPLAPANAIINGVAGAANPLYGAALRFFALMNNHPVGVLTASDNQLFYYAAYTDPSAISIITSDSLHDSTGAVASHIVAFAASQYAIDDLSARMYALVKNAAGDDFGAAGSGIVAAALVGPKDSQLIESIQAIEISNSSLGLRIGNDVTIRNDALSIPEVLHHNSYMNAVYAGFVVQASSIIGSGTRSVLLGAGEITPASAIDHDSIIGTSTPGLSVAALHLASLSAISGAAYLLVNGGVFAANLSDVSRNVYALPLVNTGTSALFGTLASIQSEPVSGKYTTPAMNVGDLYTTTDAPAIVGASAAPGDIADMWVFNDTVYIALAPVLQHIHAFAGLHAKTFTDTLYASGIFSSQPLYRSNGTIKGWTAWRRVGVPAELINGFATDFVDGTFWYIASASDLHKTAWKKYSTYLDKSFSPQQSGVQGFFDVPETTQSLTTEPGSRFSFFIATGKNRCVCIQSGCDIDNVFTPQYASSDAFVSTDGSLVGFTADKNVLDISGGVIEQCGALNAALLCHNHDSSSTAYGWIAVAGSDGCALLMHADGSGWEYGSLGKNFDGLTTDMRFVQVTSLVGVRAIACDGTFLYILTPDILARVPLTAVNCALGIHAPYTIVARANSILNLNDPFMQFTTLALDAKRILIGSNRGLITSTTTQLLSQVAGEQSFGWQLIDLPHSAIAISRIMVYSNENLGYAQSLNNAFVCVLSSYVGYEQARLYALDVTADQLSHVVVVNKLPFWYIWSAYRSHFMRSNSIDLVGRSMYPGINESPYVSRSVSPLIKSSAIKNDTHGVIPFNGKYLNLMGYISALGYTIAFDEISMYSNGDSSLPVSLE